MEKICTKCKTVLPFSSFCRCSIKKNRDGRRSWCKACENKYTQDWKHRTGRRTPCHEAKASSVYLGVVVAESIIARYFEGAQRMPYSNPGYDFICKRGHKVDVKCSTQLNNSRRKYSPFYHFGVKRNEIADYFLFLAFNNRSDLAPVHAWIVPGGVVNGKKSVNIYESALAKWLQYERPIERFGECCDEMRQGR